MYQIELNDEIVKINEHTTIMDLVSKQRQDQLYGGIVNGKIHDLNYEIKEDGKLSFIEATSEIGKLIYERSLSFLFIAAVKSLYEHTRVYIAYSFANGLYCEIEGPQKEAYDYHKIYQKMVQIVSNKEPIKRSVVSKKEAITFFESIKMKDKADLLRHRQSDECSIYHLCEFDDYFYGIMLPNTSYIKEFSLRQYQQGFWLSAQQEFIDQPNFFRIFKSFETYWKQQGLASVSQLNQKIIDGDMQDIVTLSEGIIQRDYQHLINKIMNRENEVGLILIAGPSSAGKTTFSKRLSLELANVGKQSIAISMDDYYKNRDETPVLPDGSYDFENISCVDLELFNEQMHDLLEGKNVYLPKYNFKTGKREWRTQPTIAKDSKILIVEGIHGLNPITSASISASHKFLIYINDLNTLNYDHHNRIPTSDYRLIRRMVRDYQYRGYSAIDTIKSWKKVRDGEITYIYPYQEDADFIFNTSMIYELSILKKIAMPLLNEITRDQKEYTEANRLKKLLAYIVDGDETFVPNNSILREFIGQSIFFK